MVEELFVDHPNRSRRRGELSIYIATQGTRLR